MYVWVMCQTEFLSSIFVKIADTRLIRDKNNQYNQFYDKKLKKGVWTYLR